MSIYSFKKRIIGLAAILFLVGLVSANHQAEAAFLTQRSIIVGTSATSAVTTHTIRFTLTSNATLGSMQFQYCENDPFIGTPCTAPAGLNVTGAVLSSQTGETGFSIHGSTTANNLVISRTPAVTPGNPVQYVFSNIVNPSVQSSSIYVRISTYASNDASGFVTDSGGTVFSTAGNFGTNAYVQPFLYFCVGLTVTGNCSAYTGDGIDLGELSSKQVKYGTSQAAAATNDADGYRIYSLGTTMTSGNNEIPRQETQYPSVAGIGQFGINLRDNNNPDAGEDITGNGTGMVISDYDTPNEFKFEPGDAIAESLISTDFNKYTVTYIVNVPPTQPAGIYVATITYLAVAQF